jgi:hypothetical protein
MSKKEKLILKINKKDKIIIKIGIDFGKTIGLVEQNEPYKNSYSVIRFLKNNYGNDNIYIISKAREVMRDKISKWLLKNNFFEETGLLKKNLIFCNNYEDKAILVTKLKINVFIDDHIKVIQGLIQLDQMIKIIWFNKDANLKLIEKKSRMKINITNEWNKIIKIFHKINIKYTPLQ